MKSKIKIEIQTAETKSIIENEKRAGKFKSKIVNPKLGVKIFHPKFKLTVDKLKIMWYNTLYEFETAK